MGGKRVTTMSTGWSRARHLCLVLGVVGLGMAPGPLQGETRRVIEGHAHLSLSGWPLIQRVMEENNLDAMINLSGGSSSRSMAQARELSRLSGGKIIPFYMPDWGRFGEPDFGVVEAVRLERAVREYGYGGVKISKHLGLGLRDEAGGFIPVDHPSLDPIWEKAGTLGIPVAIHVGDPKAFFEPLHPENERWEELRVHPSWSFADIQFPRRDELLSARNRVLERHPRTTFICVHFANNPEDPDTVASWMERYPNMVLDTSARVGEFGRHSAEKMHAFFVKYQGRIIFGTDIGISARGLMLGSNGAIPPQAKDIRPFYEAHWEYFETKKTGIEHPAPIQGRWTVDAIGLPESVLRKLYRENAIRWIPALRVTSGTPSPVPPRAP